MLYNVKEGKINIQDVCMHYISFGKGTKPLVLIQGLSTVGIKGMGRFLAYMYRKFARDYRVYLFDRREHVWQGITVEDLAKDVVIAMDYLKIKNAHVVGVSQGGMIAQYLAINRQDLVSKLVLVVTLSRNNATVEAVINNWLRLSRQNNIRGLIEDMAIKMFPEKYLKRYKFFMPLLSLLQKPKDMERFIILTEACLTCNTYDKLNDIKCPVLVIGGGKDKIVTGQASEEIARKMGCKIYMYEDLGRSVHQEAKDFNQRVYDFLVE